MTSFTRSTKSGGGGQSKKPSSVSPWETIRCGGSNSNWPLDLVDDDGVRFRGRGMGVVRGVSAMVCCVGCGWGGGGENKVVESVVVVKVVSWSLRPSGW